MEDILASIRRFIADDQSLAAQREPGRKESNGIAPQESPATAAQAEHEATAQPQQDEDRAETAKPASMNDDRPFPGLTHPASFRSAAASQAAAPAHGAAPHAQPAHIAPRDSFFTEGLHHRRDEAMAAREPASAREATVRDAGTEPRRSEFAAISLRQRLDDEAHVVSARAAQRRIIEPAPLSAHVSAPILSAPPLAAREPAPRPAAGGSDEPLVSPATDAAVTSSFNALLASRIAPDPEMLAELTRELLRPMLKAWLDDNLPVMVERLVRAEIERVARGGR